MKKLIIILLTAGFMAGGTLLSSVTGMNVAYAQQADAEAKRVVDAAKDRGEIGEQYDGYLGAVKTLDPKVQSAMDHINLSRQGHYLDLKENTGESELDIGKSFAITLFERAKPGHFLKWEDGSWRRK